MARVVAGSRAPGPLTRTRRSRAPVVDAVVVGSGPNGLVAANVLADAGWSVLVLEAAPTPGGGVSGATYLGDDVVVDACSAFYPLSVASPAITSMRLEEHGLEWCRSPAVLANPLPGGEATLLHADAAATAAALDARCEGDGAAWERLYGLFERLGTHRRDALCTPLPPVRSAAALARTLGPAGLLRFARLAALPVRRLGEEEFAGPAARLLLAGCTAHSDLSPESAGGASYGWLLAMLGQRHGFPVRRGGAASLTGALVRRLEARGGEVACDRTVVGIAVGGGRARGVLTATGTMHRARRAVLADVDAPALYGELLPARVVPPRLADDLRRFHWDHATVKVDWVTSGPLPWRAQEVGLAATVHITNSVDELTRYAAELATGEVPSRPFVLLGQSAVADPSRVSQGRHVLWAYTHVPREVRADPFGVVRGTWDEDDLAAIADRIEARIEVHAPGFRALVERRHVLGPSGLAAHDPNLVGGAINGGTASLHQQLALRPVPSLGRPETAVRGLFLASASAHPGGGVHGACGHNAARAALRAHGVAGPLASWALVGAQRRLMR